MKTVPAIVFGVAIVISAWFFSHSWQNTHHVNDIINVTGSAKKDFTSDLIVWSGSFIRKGKTVQDAYSSIKSDEEAIKKYLIGKGVPEKCLTFSAIDINKLYDETFDSHGNRTQVF